MGENSLPNGPGACAANGEPVAGVSRLSFLTAKLSMRKPELVVPTSMLTRFVPVELKRMSPRIRR